MPGDRIPAAPMAAAGRLEVVADRTQSRWEWRGWRASRSGQERNFTFAGNLILKWLFHPKSCYLAKSSTATSTSVQRAQIWREQCNWTEGLQLIELESSTVMQSVPEE